MDWRDIKWDRKKDDAIVGFLQMKIQMINSGSGDKVPSVQEWLNYHNSNNKDTKTTTTPKKSKKAEKAKQRRRVKQAAKFFGDMYEKDIEVKNLRGKYATELRKNIDKGEDKYVDDDIDDLLNRAEKRANTRRERQREKYRRERKIDKGSNLDRYLDRLYDNVVKQAKTPEGQNALRESFNKIYEIVQLSNKTDDEKLQILYNWRGETGEKDIETLIAAIYDEYYNLDGYNHTTGSDASRKIYAKELQHLANSLGVQNVPYDILYTWQHF